MKGLLHLLCPVCYTKERIEGSIFYYSKGYIFFLLFCLTNTVGIYNNKRHYTLAEAAGMDITVSTRVVDPHPDPDRMALWIRIRIRNSNPGSGSKGKKI
jgi:hypothetical protein